jgi:hypothetical protein
MIVIARSEATKQSSRAPAGALQYARHSRRILLARFARGWIASLRSQ